MARSISYSRRTWARARYGRNNRPDIRTQIFVTDSVTLEHISGELEPCSICRFIWVAAVVFDRPIQELFRVVGVRPLHSGLKVFNTGRSAERHARSTISLISDRPRQDPQ